MSRFYERYTHERNYGCRIREYIYRGLKTVALENEFLRICILADKGADIYEFLYKPKDIDFMWHSFNGVRAPSTVPTVQHPRGSFSDCYEGGWQELFPHIGDGDCYQGAPMGLHGEVCQTPWDYRIITDDPERISICFFLRTVRTPYYIEKTLSMNSGDPTLYIDERVVNEGFTSLKFMWGHHPALGPVFLDGSCIIEMPEENKARTIKADLGKYMVLPRDMQFQWPNIEGLDGKMWDLGRVPPPDSKIFQMFYLYDISRGWFGIRNTNRNIGFGMKWDKDIFPIIWVWAPYGGTDEYPWYGRNYNIAIEPWSNVPEGYEGGGKREGIAIEPGHEIKTSLQAYAYEGDSSGL